MLGTKNIGGIVVLGIRSKWSGCWCRFEAQDIIVSINNNQVNGRQSVMDIVTDLRPENAVIDVGILRQRWKQDSQSDDCWRYSPVRANAKSKRLKTADRQIQKTQLTGWVFFLSEDSIKCLYDSLALRYQCESHAALGLLAVDRHDDHVHRKFSRSAGFKPEFTFTRVDGQRCILRNSHQMRYKLFAL